MKQSKPDPLAERMRLQREARLARDARRPKQEERTYPVLGLDDEMPFGKHRGKTLRDVIDEDPKWIEWAMAEIQTFEITDAAEALLAEVNDVRRPPRAWE